MMCLCSYCFKFIPLRRRMYWLVINFLLVFGRCGKAEKLKEEIDPYSPRIQCNLLPEEFLVCTEPEFIENTSNLTEFQCPVETSDSYRYEDVTHVSVWCQVVDDTIECAGERNFSKPNYPCVRYNGYCFVTVLLQSIFLGCFGVDRFTLGHTGTGVAKFLTLGGVGVWWFVDIILLLTGRLYPADHSAWCIYY